jgi:hypothetical protein
VLVYDDEKVWLIDFEFSDVPLDNGDNSWNDVLQYEMNDVKRMLAELKERNPACKPGGEVEAHRARIGVS